MKHKDFTVSCNGELVSLANNLSSRFFNVSFEFEKTELLSDIKKGDELMVDGIKFIVTSLDLSAGVIRGVTRD